MGGLSMQFFNAITFHFILAFILISAYPLFSQNEDVIVIESEMVEITLSESTDPTIEWTGDIKIGRLLVMQGSREFWGTETEGENIYESPIHYGIHPQGAVEPEPAWPLSIGVTYTVKLFRWISLEPEKFQLMGIQEFTPSAEISIKTDESKEKGYKKFETLDHNNFNNPTIIDNEWMPLKPGTKFVYEGHTIEEGEMSPHRIEFIVTDITKEINGVQTVVVFDRDFSDGKLEEAELTFFAQDNSGNVWHLGQYRETYDEFEFVGGRVWLIGHLEGAKAGIMMKAKPELGTPSYSQGYAPPPFNWTDRARTYQIGQETTVPVGHFKDVLVTEEFNEEEPGAFQLKYYAKNIGNVRIGWRGDDQQQETMELTEHVLLKPAELSEVRAEAMQLDKRAYIYCTTPPAVIKSDEK